MTVEVYVSLNGLDYERLDLMKSESINMKYVYKDTQDLSKIFAPYSQSFASLYASIDFLAVAFWASVASSVIATLRASTAIE